MRKVTWIILLMLSLVLGVQPAEASRKIMHYTKERPLIYEDSWNLWPYVFINQKGRPDGLNVEILVNILERLDIPYDIRLCPIGKVKEDFRRDSVDLTIGMKQYNNSSYAQFGKSTITIFKHSILAPKRDSLKNVTQEQLYGMRFAVHKGSLSHQYLSRHGYDYAMTPLDNVEQYAMQMAVRDSGMILWNTMSLKYLKRRYNLENFALTDIYLDEGEYRFMSNDEKLLFKLDSVLEVMRKDGELEAITNKWLFPEKAEKVMPQMWRNVIIAASLFFLIIIVAAVVVYYRQSKARRKLRDTIQQMSLVLHTNSIKVWIYNPVTRKYSWLDRNGETERQYSSFEFSLFYPKDEFEKVNDKVTSIVKDDARKSEESTPESFVIPLQGYCLSDINRVLNIVLRMQPILDEYGNVKYIIGIQRDVTDSNGKMDQMRRAYYRNKAFFYTGISCVFRFDAEGRMTGANPPALQLIGVKAEEEALARGINLFNLHILRDVDFKSADTVKVTSTIEKGSKIAASPLIDASLLPDDLPFHYAAVLSPIIGKTGVIERYILRIQDISDLVANKEEMEKLHEEYEKVQNENALLSSRLDYTLNIGGTRLALYDPVEKVFTTSKINYTEPLIMSQLGVLKLAATESLPELFNIFEAMDALRDEDLSACYMSYTHFSEKEYRTMQLQMRPIYDEAQKVKAYVGILTDVTDSIQAQKKLEADTALAKETDLLKQNFINNMSYRVRTPLVKMADYIEMIAQSADYDKAEACLQSISANASRLLSLLDDTLMLSRLDAGITKLYPTSTDFDALFVSAFEAGVERYRRDNVRYIAEKSANGLFINVDIDLVSRVVKELSAFFARYVSEGMIRARYLYRKEKIQIMVESPEYVIDEALLQKVFTPVMTDDMLSSADASSGLEMAIVKAIIDLMHGDIDFEAKSDHGSSVFVTIPVG